MDFTIYELNRAESFLNDLATLPRLTRTEENAIADVLFLVLRIRDAVEAREERLAEDRKNGHY